MADAGPDQTVTYVPKTKKATVTLDGSGSSDPDGTLVSYRWMLGGSEVATGPSSQVTLGKGAHVFTLIVEDDDGETDSDTVTVTVTKPGKNN